MGLFTKDNFIHAIGGYDKLTEVCIDKGSNFLTGKATTGFQKVMSAETKTYTVITKIEGKKDAKKVFVEKDQAENYKSAQEDDLKKGDDSTKAKLKDTIKWSVEIEEGTIHNAPANIVGTAANTLGIMSAIDASPEIISAIMTEVSVIIAGKLAEAAAKITEAPISAALEMPQKMKEQMQKTFDEEKTTLGKEMKTFNTAAEERIEEDAKKSEEDNEKKQKSKLSSQLSSLNKSMAKVTDQINKKVCSIAKYIAEGPDWVSNQISKALDDQFSILDQQVENVCYDIKSGVYDFAEGAGKTAGHKLAVQYNKIIENQAKKTNNMIQENKSKARIKAFTALQKGKLKIMALTGVNIPV